MKNNDKQPSVDVAQSDRKALYEWITNYGILTNSPVMMTYQYMSFNDLCKFSMTDSNALFAVAMYLSFLTELYFKPSPFNRKYKGEHREMQNFASALIQSDERVANEYLLLNPENYAALSKFVPDFKTKLNHVLISAENLDEIQENQYPVKRKLYSKIGKDIFIPNLLTLSELPPIFKSFYLDAHDASDSQSDFNGFDETITVACTFQRDLEMWNSEKANNQSTIVLKINEKDRYEENTLFMRRKSSTVAALSFNERSQVVEEVGVTSRNSLTYGVKTISNRSMNLNDKMSKYITQKKSTRREHHGESISPVGYTLYGLFKKENVFIGKAVIHQKDYKNDIVCFGSFKLNSI